MLTGWTAYGPYGLVDQGGSLVIVILAVTFLLWTLIFERFLYQSGAYERDLNEAARAWSLRTDKVSWNAVKIREAELGRLRRHLFTGMSTMRMLVALLPLLGLLGTVRGMIDFFDILALTGASDGRLITIGIARAILPTLVAMTGAVSAILVVSFLDRRRRRLQQAVSRYFPLSDGQLRGSRPVMGSS